MLGRKNATAIFLGKLLTGIEGQAEIGRMSVLFNRRENYAFRDGGVLILIGAGLAAAIPREAKILVRPGDVVHFPRRDGIAHAIDLVVVHPKGFVLRIEVKPKRVAHTARVNLSVAAILLDADDTADAQFLEFWKQFGRRNIEGLTDSNIDAAIGPDAASAGGMIIALVGRGNQFALLDDGKCRDIRAFIKKLSRREPKHAVLFCE